MSECQGTKESSEKYGLPCDIGPLGLEEKLTIAQILILISMIEYNIYIFQNILTPLVKYILALVTLHLETVHGFILKIHPYKEYVRSKCSRNLYRLYLCFFKSY